MMSLCLWQLSCLFEIFYRTLVKKLTVLKELSLASTF